MAQIQTQLTLLFFVGLLFRFSLCRSLWTISDSCNVLWKNAISICISRTEMKKIWSSDAFANMCERHGLADVVIPKYVAVVSAIGRNYDFYDSRWHHHLDGNGNSGHFPVLIKKLSSCANGEVEHDHKTVNQWAVASGQYQYSLLPRSLDKAWQFKVPSHQLLAEPCVDSLLQTLMRMSARMLSLLK